MALLRLVCSPSLFPCSSATLFPLHHNSTTPILLPPSPISLHTTTATTSFSPLTTTPLYISHCSSSAQRILETQEEDERRSKRRVLAQNAPWTYSPDDIRPLFQKYGTVEDIEVAMYNKTRSRGLVFVTMGSHEEAKAVLENLEAYELEGRPLRLAWAKPKTKKPSSPPPSKPLPANGANVVSAEVIFNDNPRRSAGYGFVSFNTKEEADAALSSFDGKEFMGRAIRVAHSKRFLREATKKIIQSQELPSELISVAE